MNLAVQSMLGKEGIKAAAPKESMQLDVDDDCTGFSRTCLAQNDMDPEEDEITNIITRNPLSKLRNGIAKVR